MSLPRTTIVVGAGLSGLSLGQCLKAKNTPVTILEKASCSPCSNYGITLHQSVYRSLLPVLQMDESSFLEKCSIGSPGYQMDSATTRTSFRCHRGRLENILRGGLDIRWEHSLQRVEMTPRGVSLHIENGPMMRSDSLVAADGVHSVLRKSFIPSCHLNVLPYVVFNGRRSITLEDYRQEFQPYMAGQTIIQAIHGNVLFRVYVNEYTATHVSLGYTYSRPAMDNDPLHDPDRPTSGATQISEEFYAELLQFKQNELGPVFADIFDNEEVRRDRLLHWLMRSTVMPLQDLQGLADRGVWLIGDAAHPLPILGGEGANEAITDAIDLAEHLSSISSPIQNEFYARRHEEWTKAVTESEKRLSEMHASSSSSS